MVFKARDAKWPMKSSDEQPRAFRLSGFIYGAVAALSLLAAVMVRTEVGLLKWWSDLF